ncbi:MAG: hypothetical protein GX021_07820 [Tissierellia bacterium]|nr:hypothetical protein [Tissierellia bacterium]
MLENPLVVAAAIIGALFLQAYLAKGKKKITGLILPGISFINSIISAFRVESMESFGQTLAVGFATFTIYNIPTAILILIYMSAKHGYTRRRRW